MSAQPTQGLSEAEIRSHPAFDLPWYYSIELADGIYSNGRNPWAVAQARRLLQNVDVESGGPEGSGARCLDVGMMEGLISILMERRGASQVVGYDRKLRASRIDLLRGALGVGFEAIGDATIQELPGVLSDRGHDPFDVVVFSGVLYHMFDPLGGLASIRGLVRNGGICIIETAVAVDETDAMYFNSKGRFAPFALWFMTPRVLEYLARFVSLEPLDVVHRAGRPATGDKPAQGRAAIVCRAVADQMPTQDDEWMRDRDFADDFGEFLDWSSVESDVDDVAYTPSSDGLVHRDDGTLDVSATLTSTEPLAQDIDWVRLNLDARY